MILPSRHLTFLFGGLILFNVLAWSWAILVFRHHPILMGTSILAYSLGLRHAVDADHIAAIDNITRKLLQLNQRPHSVGLFFSLGHSTVVVLASAAVAATALIFKNSLGQISEIGSIIGTSVSAGFLFVIAGTNMVILRQVWLTFVRVRQGEKFLEDDLNILLAGRGLLARLLRPMFQLISRPWHMYLIGFLFGLGFDTATEVGLLGIAATEANEGLSLWSIMVFPALFTSAMALVDTLDSTVMTRAYSWAFDNPLRKLYYNLTTTCLSIVVAVLVGSIEILALLAERFSLKGTFWSHINGFSDNFGRTGYLIIGLFIFAWITSAVIYRIKGYGRSEAMSGASQSR